MMPSTADELNCILPIFYSELRILCHRPRSGSLFGCGGNVEPLSNTGVKVFSIQGFGGFYGFHAIPDCFFGP